MSEVNVQIQNPKQTVNINNPVITIEMPTDSISVEIVEGQPIEIQVQNPVIEVNIGGPCDCSGGGHEIQDEGTPLAQRAKLNFIGPGVTATDNPGQGATDVTIPGGGGGSYEEVTYAEMQALIDANGLTPGGWYLITDASGTDLGFLTYAVTENQISVSGVGGYLNADFQAVGDYSGTPETFGTHLGIWRHGFETVTINYLNLPPDEIAYTTSSGLLTDGETFTTDLGRSGTVVTDNGSIVTATGVSGTLVAGEIITGDISGNTVTVDSYSHFVFAAGDTITGGTTGATAVVVSDDTTNMVVYMTSAGVAFNGSEVLDNGAGVTADQDGAATGPTIVFGDVVIWNLLHYQLTDSSLLDGTDPATNSAAYTALAKGDYPETYFTAWDVSEFDFPQNAIVYRQDLLGGLVRGTTGVSGYQFGRDACAGNNIQSPATFDIRNLISGFNNNTTYSGSTVSDIITGAGTAIENNILENGASLTGITAGANCSISRNKVGQGATLGGSTTMGDGVEINDNIIENNGALSAITAGTDCVISKNKIGPSAYMGNGTTMADEVEFVGNTLLAFSNISNITASNACSISFNQLGNAAEITGCILENEAIIDGIYIYNTGILANKTLDGSSGGPIEGWIIGNDLALNKTETISAPTGILRCESGFSNFSVSIDITGLNTLDCLAENNYVGIFNLTSSNATEAIDTITNPPTLFQFTIRPEAGLVLTITGTAYAGIAAGQIALKATDYTLDGDKGEYIVLEIDPLGTGALIEKQVVNGLI